MGNGTVPPAAKGANTVNQMGTKVRTIKKGVVHPRAYTQKGAGITIERRGPVTVERTRGDDGKLRTSAVRRTDTYTHEPLPEAPKKLEVTGHNLFARAPKLSGYGKARPE